jgi:hypothetical protein
MQIKFWNDERTKTNAIIKYEPSLVKKNTLFKNENTAINKNENQIKNKIISKITIDILEDDNSKLYFDCDIWQNNDLDLDKNAQTNGFFYLFKNNEMSVLKNEENKKCLENNMAFKLKRVKTQKTENSFNQMKIMQIDPKERKKFFVKKLKNKNYLNVPIRSFNPYKSKLL